MTQNVKVKELFSPTVLISQVLSDMINEITVWEGYSAKQVLVKGSEGQETMMSTEDFSWAKNFVSEDPNGWNGNLVLLSVLLQ